MKIGDEVYVHGFVDEIRRDTVIIRNEGGYFGTVKDELFGGIVLCKDCKWAGKEAVCKLWNRHVAHNGFCSYAVREIGESDDD